MSNPPARKKRVSTLDRRDLFFKAIVSYLLARNKYILSFAQRWNGVSMTRKKNKTESNRMIDACAPQKKRVPLLHSSQKLTTTFNFESGQLIPFWYLIYKKNIHFTF
jgi:hypothetical protein